MRVCTLASGSSGNSLLVETDHTRILVDAGISRRRIKKKLDHLGIAIEELDAVITTHEHQDHTLSITKLDLPVYVTSSTVHIWKDKVKSLCEFDTGSDFSINDIVITPFSVPHDAIDPVGFSIITENRKIGIVTDIGSVTGLVVQKLRDSNVLFVESNHDSNMMLYSNYPWELKQRIKSRLGHLSNDQSSALIAELLNDNLEYIILAHLSEVNNNPETALKEAVKVLNNKGADHVRIGVAPRKEIGEVIEF